MLIHYCVIAFKNIWKYKVSASISILGLAFALVCFVPILYWMDHETTYDSFYKDSESIYRVYSTEKQSGKVNKGASKGIENSLREQVPAIEASTTLMLSPENCRTQGEASLTLEPRRYEIVIKYLSESHKENALKASFNPEKDAVVTATINPEKRYTLSDVFDGKRIQSASHERLRETGLEINMLQGRPALG